MKINKLKGKTLWAVGLFFLLFAFLQPIYGIIPGPEQLTLSEVLDSGCLLLWDPVAEATEYLVYISTQRNKEYRLLSRTKQNSIRVYNLENGRTYFINIIATNGLDNSAPSNTVMVIPEDLTPPPPPLAVHSHPGKKDITIKWQKCNTPDFLHYTIYRKIEGKPNFVPLDADTGQFTTQFVDHNVKTGVNYVYRITASDRRGNESPPSREVVGQTRFPAYLIFKKGEDRYHVNCFNPNDRSVFYGYAYLADLTRWSTWRRTVFNFEAPPGRHGKTRHLIITRNMEQNVAVVIYPETQEIFMCGEERGKWKKWRQFSKNLSFFKDQIKTQFSFDVLFIKRVCHIFWFNHEDRSIWTTSTRNGAEYTEPVRICKRLGFLPDEKTEITFSALNWDEKKLDALFGNPEQRQFFQTDIPVGSDNWDQFHILFAPFVLPPNF